MTSFLQKWSSRRKLGVLSCWRNCRPFSVRLVLLSLRAKNRKDPLLLLFTALTLIWLDFFVGGGFIDILFVQIITCDCQIWGSMFEINLARNVTTPFPSINYHKWENSWTFSVSTELGALNYFLKVLGITWRNQLFPLNSNCFLFVFNTNLIQSYFFLFFLFFFKEKSKVK